MGHQRALVGEMLRRKLDQVGIPRRFLSGATSRKTRNVLAITD
jgi:hypothetical protein